MIDIHTHILPYIDDGSNSLEESYKMLEKAVKIGITDIILTPHALRINIPNYPKENLLESFNTFYEQVKNKYNINLYLGQEISYHRNLISELKDNKLLSLNGSEYILIELPFNNEIDDFDELVYSCKILGYKIIIAHVERYKYLNFKKMIGLRDYGVLFQVNSNSITGRSGNELQKLVFKLFKNHLVEFVGSDVHSFRKNDLDEAYQVIEKKFGEELATKVFKNNPKELFNIQMIK